MYVKEGVTNRKEMKRLLKIYVKTEIFKDGVNLPEPSNKRFYPRSSTISNHIGHSRRKLSRSLIDQECLQHKIKEWTEADPTSNIFFRPKGTKVDDVDESLFDSDSDSEDGDHKLNGPKDSSLLFVYQSGWQKRLLSKYGDELVLLDATYRTTRYALPIFFFVVKTNIDYQIVAIFVCENETEECITEALTVIKSWNTNLSPKYGMTDYCTEEINSMEKVFPGRFRS